jgi:hypothetical protein
LQRKTPPSENVSIWRWTESKANVSRIWICLLSGKITGIFKNLALFDEFSWAKKSVATRNSRQFPNRLTGNPAGKLRRESGISYCYRDHRLANPADRTSTCPIERTEYAAPALVQDMRVNLRRRQIGMPQQFLDRPNVIAGF